MTAWGEKLSAYLDGELPDDDARAVEELLETDPAAQAEFETLVAADAAAGAEFEKMLSDPVPLALAGAIRSAKAPRPAVRRGLPKWAAIAASICLLALGGLGGYLVRSDMPGGTQIAEGGWLQEIAEYHAVYATQTRHLAEVPASESDHIEAWLGRTVGAEFSIPDLTDQGLTFEGGRLLVAAGKPVAQLLYTDADGEVVALCLKASAAGPTEGFATRTIGDFNMVTWRDQSADFVVVGPAGNSGLERVASAAAQRV